MAVVFAFQFWSEGEFGTILLTIVRPWGRFHHLIQFEAVGRYDWFDIPEWYLDEIRSQLGKTVRFPDWDAVAKLLLDTSMN